VILRHPNEKYKHGRAHGYLKHKVCITVHFLCYITASKKPKRPQIYRPRPELNWDDVKQSWKGHQTHSLDTNVDGMLAPATNRGWHRPL
jgi:hypothetical protein